MAHEQTEDHLKKTFDLKAYALAGAEARVRELRAELESIYTVFPALRKGGAAPAASRASGTPARTRGARKARRAMSAAERKAVSARMKKYWAARRKTSKAAKPSEQ